MLTGLHVASWAEQAAAGLSRHRDEINELNVFPIPDSDTGSNMTATMESAVARMHQDHGSAGSAAIEATSVADVASSLAAGAVTGARGNSGLVLSQFLRAMADAASASRDGGLAVREVPGMLHRAEQLVRRAVSDPVEGTIISVLHAAAEQSAACVEEAADPAGVTLGDIAVASRDAAAEALAATTAQLPELASAGVVDAGGRGLVVILDALVDALDGVGLDRAGQGPDAGSEPPAEAATAEATAEIEVMFTYGASEENLDDLREQLHQRGNSVVIVPAERDGTWRVHVHTGQGGALIEHAFRTGEVRDLALEALPVVEAPVEPPRPTAPVLALVPAGGLRDMFTGAGATAGDTATIVREFERRGTGCIVLTNGQDTAELFGQLASSSGEATVVDTESFVGGLAAMAVYSPTADLDENAEEMADAVSAQQWRETGGGADALNDLVEELLAGGGELVTVLYDGEAEDADEVSGAVEELRSAHPTVEMHAYPVAGLGAGAQVGVE